MRVRAREYFRNTRDLRKKLSYHDLLDRLSHTLRGEVVLQMSQQVTLTLTPNPHPHPNPNPNPNPNFSADARDGMVPALLRAGLPRRARRAHAG